MNFFEFILFVIYSVSWIHELMSFATLGNSFNFYLNVFQFCHFLFLLRLWLTWVLDPIYSFTDPWGSDFVLLMQVFFFLFKLHDFCFSLFSSVQWFSHVWLFANPWTAARQASLSITNSHSLLKLMSIESVMPSNHFILCHPLLLPPSIFPSIRVLSDESVLCIRWPEYWSFSFGISPSNEYSWLISFRIDWLDLLAVQGSFCTLLYIFYLAETLKKIIKHVYDYLFLWWVI